MIKDRINLININILLEQYYIKLPSFQRAYTWGKKEIYQFLKDLEYYAINKNYFIGNIFGYLISDKELYIIDGQQRITTLYLLLNGIRLIDNKQFIGLNISFFDDNDIARFDTEEASPFCHYLFNNDDLDTTYKSLVEESNKDFTKMNLYFGQKYICEFLEEHQKLKDEIVSIMKNLEIILIFCEDSSYGYQIFENINSKGQALNNVDLIKNAFFNRIKNKRGEKDFNSFKYNLWKEIEEKFYTKLSEDDTFEKLAKKNAKSVSNFHQMFAYYNQLKFGKKHSRNSRQLYNNYVLKLDDMNQNQLKDELSKILNITKAYNYVINPFDKSIPTLESVQNCIIFLDNLGIKLYIPFAIALINKVEEGEYRNFKKEIKKLFCKISVFHFIFNTVYSMKPSLVENKYNSLAHDVYNNSIKFQKIKNQVEIITVETIENYIGIDFESNCDNYRKNLYKVLFTTDRSGTPVKKAKGYKKSKDTLQINFLLGIIEQFLKNDYSNIPTIDTVEHINCLKDAGKNEIYNFCIFNFLPLEKDINEACKDKNLSEKILIYKKSNYMLVKMFCENYEKYKNNEELLKENWEKEITKILISLLKI